MIKLKNDLINFENNLNNITYNVEDMVSNNIINQPVAMPNVNANANANTTATATPIQIQVTKQHKETSILQPEKSQVTPQVTVTSELSSSNLSTNVATNLLETLTGVQTTPIVFPTLSLDDIRKNLDVLKYVGVNEKLWLQNLCELTIDQSYFPLNSWNRWRGGQSRLLIHNFLKHLLLEVKRHTNVIISDINNKVDINTNVNHLKSIIENFVRARQGLTNIKETYSLDSSIKSDFNTLEEDFDNFFRSLIYSMVVRDCSN
jgi:hypothetical protein